MVCTNIVIIALIFLQGAVVVEEDKGTEMRVIDTFTNCVSKGERVPCGWRATRSDVEMFSVLSDSGNSFVKIRTVGGNTTIGLNLTFDTEKYSYLCWRWRMHTLPLGGREDRKRLADSGAGVYVVFHDRFRMNRILKYVWSSTLPSGTVTVSPYNSRVKIVVLRSGSEESGRWVEEKVNVLKDFVRQFGCEPPGIEAIAIMSDADNTQSSAEADYDDFRMSRN